MAAKKHYKMFNGKRYRYEKSNPSKAGALNYADKMRKNGRFAGVVAEREKGNGAIVWSVYTRKM